MDKSSANWSFLEAARVFCATLRGDLGGFATQRRALLAHDGIVDGSVHFGGRTMTYLAAGDVNAPPVIFLHGSPGGAHEWGKFLIKPDGLCVIALDRPGYGPLGQSVPDLRTDTSFIGACLPELAGGKKVILVGHSLGGGIAAALAAAYPERVKGLVFVGASLDPSLEKVMAAQKIFEHAPLSWLLTRSIRHSNVELAEYAESYLKQVDIKGVRCPVVVVHSRDDNLVSFKNAAYIRENFINAESVDIMELDSGGHFLGETRPDDIRKAIRTVL